MVMGGNSRYIEFLDWKKKDEWKTLTNVRLDSYGYYDQQTAMIFNR